MLTELYAIGSRKVPAEAPAGFVPANARYPRCGPLLTHRLNTSLITGMWDGLLRVAASVKGGHATAALVVGKLCSSKRQQNALTSAIKEYGALCPHPVRHPLPRRRDVQTPDRPAAEQGRESAGAAPHPRVCR